MCGGRRCPPPPKPTHKTAAKATCSLPSLLKAIGACNINTRGAGSGGTVSLLRNLSHHGPSAITTSSLMGCLWRSNFDACSQFAAEMLIALAPLLSRGEVDPVTAGGELGPELLTPGEGVADFPAYPGKGPTNGVLVRPNGSQVPLESGYDGPALDLPKPRPGMNNNNVSHVEAHAAAIMRSEGLTEADLYINRMPCPGTNGCMQLLSRMVPSGSTLNIFVMSRGSAGSLNDWIIVKGTGP
jgi:Double-stranded DNA deaminase toxin A